MSQHQTKMNKLPETLDVMMDTLEVLSRRLDLMKDFVMAINDEVMKHSKWISEHQTPPAPIVIPLPTPMEFNDQLHCGDIPVEPFHSGGAD